MMAVAGAWARGFWRDRSGMALSLVLPPLVYLLFAAVFGAGARGDIDASVALHDAARTPATAAVGEALSRDLGPRLRRLDDAQAVERAVIDGRADAGKAFETLRRALHEDPSDRETAQDLERLAASLAGAPLQAIVHNATAANFSGARSAQGHELTFAVGQLAPWVLTTRLLPTLIRQETAGVIWVSSQSHTAARLAPTDIVAAGPESADAAYARTKLANLATHFALAARWAGTSLQSVAFDPGPTETPLMAKLRANNHGVKGWLLRRVVPRFSRSAEVVAQDLAWAVEQSQRSASQGAYFGTGRRLVRAASRARDPERAAAVFAACEEITGVSSVTADDAQGEGRVWAQRHQ